MARLPPRVDGLLSAFDSSKFRLLEEKHIDFQISPEDPLFNRQNVSLATVLAPVSQSKLIFIIANVHVLFNDRRADVKMGQVLTVLRTLEALKEKYSKENDVAIIWGGDFNTLPNSAIYNYLTTKKLNHFEAIWLMSGQYLGKNFILNGQLSKKDLFFQEMTKSYSQRSTTREKTTMKNLEWLHYLKRSRVILGEKNVKVSIDPAAESFEEFLQNPNLSFLSDFSLSLKSGYSTFNKIAYSSLGFKPLECFYPEKSNFEPFFTSLTPTDLGSPDLIL